MKECYRCNIGLDATNEAYEHIIINACGGRLKSKSLLCQSCNSLYGSSFDKELATQTNDLVTILGIERQKGEALPVKGKAKRTGEEYYFHVDDTIEKVKPKITFTGEGENRQLSIEASDMKMLRQVLNGYKRKHPNIDVEAAINSAKESFVPVNGEIKFNSSIGGDETFKAITKCAINFFIYKHGDRAFIKHLIPYLDATEKQDVVWMHYPNELIHLPKEREVSHVICVIGNPEERILYAYIELFNCHNYLLKLNDHYTGKAINETYVFDLIEKRQVSARVNLSYSREQLLNFFANKDYSPFTNVQNAMYRVVELSRIFSRERKMRKAFWRAWNNSLGKYPTGTVVTEEMAGEFSRLYANEIIPFLNLRDA